MNKSIHTLWTNAFQLLLSSRSRNRSERKAKSKTSRRHIIESLERRELFSVDLTSAMALNSLSGIQDIAVDVSGNSYATGYFSGTTDFDIDRAYLGDVDVLVARGTKDGFVAKYAPDDSLLWVKQFGSNKVTEDVYIDETGRYIDVDTNGNVLVMGEFLDTSNFGTINATAALGLTKDAFVAKLDQDGSFLWVKNWGGTSTPLSNSIETDSLGNTYALASNGSLNVRKFNSNGSVVWNATIATVSSFPDMAVDASGNIIVTGTYNGTVDFDPTSKTKNLTVGSRSSFLLKLTPDARLAWVNSFANLTSTSNSSATVVDTDRSNNIIVSGTYNGVVDFNPGTGTVTLPATGKAFVSKYSSNGSFVWAKAIEAQSANVKDVAVDTFGSVYILGGFFGNIDLDPSGNTQARTSNGEQDIFMLKLTSSGQYNWCETFGGVGLDIATGIAVAASGDVYAVGRFGESVDFDPDPLETKLLTAAGSKSGFKLRLRQV